jgi:serine/threonine-protein kinase
MSPEQVRGVPSDGRADIYGVGVTLYEMLTGYLPHEAETVDELFRLKLVAPPMPPSSFVDIDPLTEDVLMRALAVDPAARHATARELRIELMEVIASLKDGGDKPLTVSIWPEPKSSSADRQ